MTAKQAFLRWCNYTQVRLYKREEEARRTEEVRRQHQPT
jgi:hypothetical protein